MNPYAPMILGVFGLFLAVFAQAQSPPAPLQYTCIYADSVGESHFADEHLALAWVNPGPGIPPTPASAPTAATGLIFLCPAAGEAADWHPAPRRQYNFILSGEVEVEVSDGEVRRFGPGSVLLLADTAGRGHRTRIVSEEGACFATVGAVSE